LFGTKVLLLISCHRATEIAEIKQLAENHEPVFRNYTLNIVDDAGTRIAEVEKVLYIRLKKPKASA